MHRHSYHADQQAQNTADSLMRLLWRTVPSAGKRSVMPLLRFRDKICRWQQQRAALEKSNTAESLCCSWSRLWSVQAPKEICKKMPIWKLRFKKITSASRRMWPENKPFSVLLHLDLCHSKVLNIFCLKKYFLLLIKVILYWSSHTAVRIRNLFIISHLSLWKYVEADPPQGPSDTTPLFRSWLGCTVWPFEVLKWFARFGVAFLTSTAGTIPLQMVEGSCKAWASLLQTVLSQLLHPLPLDGISRNQNFQYLISKTATLRLPLAVYFLIWKISLLHRVSWN